MLVLDESHLRAVLTMRDAITAVEDGFLALGRGEAQAPERLRLDIPSQAAVLLQMPASIEDNASPQFGEGRSAVGTKIVSVFPNNVSLGLDTIQGVYLLLNPVTGSPIALMDARFITAIRTAATSAVATRYMARPGPKTLAVFGAGVQARFHIEAMMAVAEIERVLLASRSVNRARELAGRVEALFGIGCEIVPSEGAAQSAGLICTCTSAHNPLFDGELLQPGTHINAVGAFTPATRELDTTTVKRSRVIIDAESAAGREAGEISIPLAEGAISTGHVKGTLAEIVSGEKPGRTSPEEITLFKSCGLAIEDLVTAKLAYARAKARGVGTEVPLQ